MQNADNTKQKRAFSQANLETKSRGPLGDLLASALTIPPSETSKLFSTHGFHSYPGRFHPKLVRTLLEHDILKNANTVLDPFMGGGTTLVECMLHGKQALGNDLNPLALLVSAERCRMANSEHFRHLKAIVNQIKEHLDDQLLLKVKHRVNRKHLQKLKGFYAPHLFAEMVQWVDAVDNLPRGPIRESMRAVFSSLVVKFSNKLSDSSEEITNRQMAKGSFGQWMVRKADELARMQEQFNRKLPANLEPPRLVQSNVLELLPMQPQGVDTIITSPPYPGTYDYFNHHELRLLWLNLPTQPLKLHELGTKRNHSAKQWKQVFREIMLAFKRQLKPGGDCFMVIGDWLDRETPVNGLEFLEKYAPSVGLHIQSSASIKRRIHQAEHAASFGTSGRWEHLIHLKTKHA